MTSFRQPICAVLAVAALALLGGCGSTEHKPESKNIDISVSLAGPFGRVRVGVPTEMPSPYDRDVKAFTVVNRAKDKVTVQFTCPDGSMPPPVDIPLDGQPHETGCTVGGKPVRITVRP